ncbi:unnamed protein product [Cuscuta europaea]|uniref:PUM-HD domain-containing protein n=1 Tax=Cuscuta europaea TaxID=41803 RepID=A0A9P0YIG2_CUSEU|nr:unnamed protein product [Cuscuta europaea]
MDEWIGDQIMSATGNRRYPPPDWGFLSPSDNNGGLFQTPMIRKHNHHQFGLFQVSPNNGIHVTTNTGSSAALDYFPAEFLPSTRLSPAAGSRFNSGGLNPYYSPHSSRQFQNLGDPMSSNFRVGIRNLPALEQRVPARFYRSRDETTISLRELEEALLESSININLGNGFRFRNNNIVNMTPPRLEELRGGEKMIFAIKDQQSCRFLQLKLEEGKPEEVEVIFSEAKDRVGELMIDPSGNYLIQKLFQVCNSHQMNHLLLSAVRDERQLLAICLDMHGTRAMQTMLQNLRTKEQRVLVVSALRRIAVTLAKSVNGHHVIQHCIKFFSHEEKKPLLNVIAENCVNIATDKSGCCVIQHCVENADVQSREPLIAEITANSLALSEHPYGNYVVQNILGLKIAGVKEGILKKLRGSFVSLSMNKYGSNVVEKCLKEFESEEAIAQIVQEIMYSPNLLMLLQDQYGNYVAQSALATCKGYVRQEMVTLINGHYNYLQSHPYGKRVLAKTRGNKQSE